MARTNTTDTPAAQALDTPAAYEPGAVYRVALTRPITVARVALLPISTHDMSGEFLNRVIEEAGADAVDTAERL